MRAATGGDRILVRNWICVSPLCEARPTAALRAVAIAVAPAIARPRPVMAVLAARLAMVDRIVHPATAVAATPQAVAAILMAGAVVGPRAAAEVVDIPAAAEAATPVVAATPAADIANDRDRATNDLDVSNQLLSMK